jgi:hypothetical protein
MECIIVKKRVTEGNGGLKRRDGESGDCDGELKEGDGELREGGGELGVCWRGRKIESVMES